MDVLEALHHLATNPNNVEFHTYEWSEAGMWNAVCRILNDYRTFDSGAIVQPVKRWTAEEIDAMIADANNN